MKRFCGQWLSLATVVLLAMGCRALHPSSSTAVKSPWNSFEEAQGAFDRIASGQTTTNELECLGFGPFANPNVKILTYLDVMTRFLPNVSIRKEDLPTTVRDCLEAKEGCQAYEIDLTVTQSKRYGNLFLDMFAFNRKTRETGWSFKALLVLHHDTVVYKLWSGEPRLERYDAKKKPLGPLQELDSVIRPSMPSF